MVGSVPAIGVVAAVVVVADVLLPEAGGQLRKGKLK